MAGMGRDDLDIYLMKKWFEKDHQDFWKEAAFPEIRARLKPDERTCQDSDDDLILCLVELNRIKSSFMIYNV